MFKAIARFVKDSLGVGPPKLSHEQIRLLYRRKTFKEMTRDERAAVTAGIAALNFGQQVTWMCNISRPPIEPPIVANASDTPADAEALQARLRSLFDQNWRAMRDVQFEEYLKAVFEAQGYHVELTGVTGDQGVDLIVVKNGVRTAIQVKGYHNSVSNAAVQQAFTGMKHYQCDGCAVITNSRFTNSAVQLSTTTNCRLIDERRFEAFVMGGLESTTPG